MTKIAFYGASVTQQRNGYVKYFAKLSTAKVLKLGFGGMQLSDAGICFIDKVVEIHPDICFIDWFSTWYMNQDGKFSLYLDVIAEKLQKINCRIIFLFFPQNKDLNISNIYAKLRSSLPSYMIPTIMKIDKFPCPNE